MSLHDETLIRKPSPTRTLNEKSIIRPIARWGELWPGKNPTVSFIVTGYEASPLRIEVADQVVIGRSVENDASIVTLDAFEAYESGVSRRHVVLFESDDLLKIMDLDSTNGTFLNGRPLFSNQTYILRDDDMLHLGQLEIRVSFTNPSLK